MLLCCDKACRCPNSRQIGMAMHARRICDENKMTDNETRSVAMRVSNEDSSPVAIAPAGLEEAKQFENDYNNDNYSDYVEDASVHAVD
jgi:hypothetical protein